LSEAKIGMERNNIISIICDNVTPPEPFNRFKNVNLVNWKGDDKQKEFQELLSTIQKYSFVKMLNFKKTKMVRIQNSLSFDMVTVKAGSFKMGSKDYGDEKPIHKVTIKESFELGTYPVTVGEYLHFVKATKKEVLEKWSKEKENHPVTDVSWDDAVAYCNWLNEQQTEYVYRLPSEVEWEYACRAGTTTDWCFGDDEKELYAYAWYEDNSNGTTHVVGEKKKNPWGLFDMHGNVWEWCEDWYDEDKDRKVLRGGSWSYYADATRSASRSWYFPTDRNNIVGFRLLRTLP
jgi:formylglycine-generating enzyme required for sulfatase activity